MHGISSTCCNRNVMVPTNLSSLILSGVHVTVHVSIFKFKQYKNANFVYYGETLQLFDIYLQRKCKCFRISVV